MDMLKIIRFYQQSQDSIKALISPEFVDKLTDVQSAEEMPSSIDYLYLLCLLAGTGCHVFTLLEQGKAWCDSQMHIRKMPTEFYSFPLAV
jgi:hypothetical protein